MLVIVDTPRKDQFVFPGNANALQMLTSQNHNKKFGRVENSPGGENSPVVSNSLNIPIRRKYELGLRQCDGEYTTMFTENVFHLFFIAG